MTAIRRVPCDLCLAFACDQAYAANNGYNAVQIRFAELYFWSKAVPRDSIRVYAWSEAAGLSCQALGIDPFATISGRRGKPQTHDA